MTATYSRKSIRVELVQTKSTEKSAYKSSFLLFWHSILTYYKKEYKFITICKGRTKKEDSVQD